MLVVRRRLLRVELLRVLLRHRRREPGGRGAPAKTAPAPAIELEHDRLVVGRLDARDVLVLLSSERLETGQVALIT